MRASITKTVSMCLVVLLGSCGRCGGGTVAAPRALVKCIPAAGGSLTGTVTGIGVNPVTLATTDVNSTATITNPTDSTVTWSNGGTVSADNPISGTDGTGKVTLFGVGAAADSADVFLTYKVSGTTIVITGRIRFIPPPCTGSGTWTATADDGRSVGSGTWTIP